MTPENYKGGVAMNIYYFYIILLLLMFVLIYKGTDNGFNHAPIKIRIITLLALGCMSLKYIALIILLITKNIKYLYLLKPLVFLNILSIPLLAITAIYIFARNDRIKFNYCIVLSVVFAALYSAVIIMFPVSLSSYGNLGYTMVFISDSIVQLGCIIINTVFLFTAVVLLGGKNIDVKGMWLVTIAAFISIIEYILKSSGISIFPAILFGDILWILALNYSLYKFKK